MDEVLVNYFGSTFRSRVVNVCVSVCTHTKRAHVSARCTRLANHALAQRGRCQTVLERGSAGGSKTVESLSL